MNQNHHIFFQIVTERHSWGQKDMTIPSRLSHKGNFTLIVQISSLAHIIWAYTLQYPIVHKASGPDKCSILKQIYNRIVLPPTHNRHSVSLAPKLRENSWLDHCTRVTWRCVWLIVSNKREQLVEICHRMIKSTAVFILTWRRKFVILSRLHAEHSKMTIIFVGIY